jgi:hypothetical protein
MKRRPWNGALQVTFIELQHREVIHGAYGGRDGTGKCRVELKVHSLRISESPQFIRSVPFRLLLSGRERDCVG